MACLETPTFTLGQRHCSNAKANVLFDQWKHATQASTHTCHDLLHNIRNPDNLIRLDSNSHAELLEDAKLCHSAEPRFGLVLCAKKGEMVFSRSSGCTGPRPERPCTRLSVADSKRTLQTQ